MVVAEEKRKNMLKEKAVELQFKISRLGVAGRAYYEAAQIKLQRNRMQIRNARTQNMLLHAALSLLTKKEQIAHKQAGDLEGMHKNAKALHQEFDDQRCRTIAMQLELVKKITDTKSVENEYAHLLDPNTPPLQRLRILDAKLEAIFGNIRDTQIVEKQFENLLKPMREEHIVYSLQLDNIEAILKIKQGKMMELKMLRVDATKSRNQAKKELDEYPTGSVSPEQQKRILQAIEQIKRVMEVNSMKAMYTQYVNQEKQSVYLAQVYKELKATISQLKNEASVMPQKQRASMPLAQVHALASNTKDLVRRVSVAQKRKNSYPLIMIIDGTQKLVDKLHQNNVLLVKYLNYEEK
ncbi:hypothetical protein CY35_18G073300 [Sphagnum magellanicum]|nr:hypothetical protein CY35_18G073300 [Sphagnum magellanicum]